MKVKLDVIKKNLVLQNLKTYFSTTGSSREALTIQVEITKTNMVTCNVRMWHIILIISCKIFHCCNTKLFCKKTLSI